MADSSGIEAIASAVTIRAAHAASQTLLSDPAPCDACRFREPCAAEQLACDRFVMFHYGKSRSRWGQAPTLPNRAQFEALFNPERCRL